MLDLLEEVTAFEAWLIVVVILVSSGLGVVALNYKTEADVARKELADQKAQVAYAYEQLAHDMMINYLLCEEVKSNEH